MLAEVEKRENEESLAFPSFYKAIRGLATTSQSINCSLKGNLLGKSLAWGSLLSHLQVGGNPEQVFSD